MGKTIEGGIQTPGSNDNQGAKGADKDTGRPLYVHGKRGLGSDDGSGVNYFAGDIKGREAATGHYSTQSKGIKGQTGKTTKIGKPRGK